MKWKLYLKKSFVVMRRIFFVTLSWLFFLSSCNSTVTSQSESASEEAIENLSITTPKLIKTVESFSDTTFFKTIRSFYHQKHFFLADVQRDRVLVLDSTMKLLRIIGRSGSGPGELMFAFSAQACDSTLYVYDEGNQRFNLYNWHSGCFKSSFRNPVANVTHNYFAVDKHHQLYLSCPQCPMPIVKVDSTGRKVSEFGQFVKGLDDTPKARNIANHRLLTYNDLDNWVYAALTTGTVIEKYSLAGQQIDKIDLRDQAYFDRVIENFDMERQKTANSNSRKNFFTGMALAPGRLYALYVNWEVEPAMPCKILVVKLDSPKMEIEKVIDLCGNKGDPNIFGGMSVDNLNSRLLLQNGKSEFIDVYDLGTKQ
jgi:6-bladed beta-propeller